MLLLSVWTSYKPLRPSRRAWTPSTISWMVIGWVVADRTGDILLLEAADAVLEAGRARDRPRTRKFLVAFVGHVPLVVVFLGWMVDHDLLQLIDVRNHPRLGPVGEIPIGHQ